MFPGLKLEFWEFFLRARLSSAVRSIFSSPDLSCLVRVPLHLGWSAARFSQDPVSMSRAFMSLLTTSEYRSFGRPMLRFPDVNSPYSRSLGILPSSMRWTWPSQRSLHCLRMVCMLGRPALDKTSALVTLSCQEMPRMRRRYRRWKVLSPLSCLAYVVYESPP